MFEMSELFTQSKISVFN